MNRWVAGYAPTPAAAQARLEAIDPAAYARSRNHLDGAVTGLGPYITHGFLSLPGVRAHLVSQHHARGDHKLIFELAWREYFRHVWAHEGDGILQSLHEGPLPDAAYARELPSDLREARTGVPVVDAAVRQLYGTGVLHNHARMWLASYTVHLRKVHWRTGADWMISHLIDGDLASNHLSWQWVAGTASAKPYLFNADNVARHAPRGWHSPGTAIDCSYDELDRVARTTDRHTDSQPITGGIAPVLEPPCHAAPPHRWRSAFTQPDALRVAGRDLWIMHPWHLASPHTILPLADGGLPPVVIGVLDLDFLARHPWSDKRWDFIASRMVDAAVLCWAAPARELAHALHSARSVHGIADPHLSPPLRALPLTPGATMFSEPRRRCHSFSAFWTAVGPRKGGDCSH